MAYNTHLLRYKKITNEWHRELLAYVDDAEQKAGVPTTRPPFSSYPGTFLSKKKNQNENDNQLKKNVGSSTMSGKTINSDCRVQKQTEIF